MTFEILILTQPSRSKFLGQLLSILQPQVDAFPDVELRVNTFRSPYTLGENRERMRKTSFADYVCFVDDDDLVAPDYVARIVPHLDGVDYVGFKVQMHVNERLGPLVTHSLRCTGWTSGAHWEKGRDATLERDISHLNPMRRELAIVAPMEGGRGEDDRWAHAMRALGLLKTEHFVDSVLYHYIRRKPKKDKTDWKEPWRLRMLK